MLFLILLEGNSWVLLQEYHNRMSNILNLIKAIRPYKTEFSCTVLPFNNNLNSYNKVFHTSARVSVTDALFTNGLPRKPDYSLVAEYIYLGLPKLPIKTSCTFIESFFCSSTRFGLSLVLINISISDLQTKYKKNLG